MKTPDGEEITDKLLCERFPLLFADRAESMQNTAMCWGFDVGPGWMGIIYDAAEMLELLIKEFIARYPKPHYPTPRIDWFTFQHPIWFLHNVWHWLKNIFGPLPETPWWPRASQVKEKYGTLRFYMTSETPSMSLVVDRAEDKSGNTCEECGEPGRVRGTGWQYTRCYKCWRRLLKEKNA